MSPASCQSPTEHGESGFSDPPSNSHQDENVCGTNGSAETVSGECLSPGRSDRLVSVVGAVAWPWSSLPPVRTWNSMAQPCTSGSVSLCEARPAGVPAGGGGAQVLEWSPCSRPGNGHTGSSGVRLPPLRLSWLISKQLLNAASPERTDTPKPTFQL